MRPSAVLLICGALASAAVAAIGPGVVLREPFETDLSGWVVGTHVPADPNDPAGGPVATDAAVADDNVFAGEHALRLYLDGRQDDGTLWVERPVGVLSEAGADLTVRFWFYSPFGGSFNNLANAVAYIGTRPPRVEGDFARLAPVTDIDGWEPLVHSARLDGAVGDSVWVAVGFSVVWEAEQVYYVDDLSVESSGPATAVAASTWGRLKEARRD